MARGAVWRDPSLFHRFQFGLHPASGIGERAALISDCDMGWPEALYRANLSMVARGTGMRGHLIVAALLLTAQVLALEGSSRAQDAAEQAPALTRSIPVALPAPPTATPIATEPSAAAPAAAPALTVDLAAPADAVVAAIRFKLADPGLRTTRHDPWSGS